VFGATRNGSCAFFANLGLKVRRGGSGVYIGRLRRFSYGAIEVRVCRNELAFALVPRFQDFGRRRAAKDYASRLDACLYSFYFGVSYCRDE